MSEGSGRVLSLCDAHAAHVQQRVQAAKHPRGDIKHAELREKMLLAYGPSIIERQSPGFAQWDADTKAEMLHQFVDKVLARMD